MQETREFPAAPLDSYAAQVTTGVAYLGGVLMLPILFAYLGNVRWTGLIIPIAVALALMVFLVLSYAARPVRYRLEAEHLVVQRQWLPRLKIPLQEITAVSVASSLADVPRRGLRFAFNPGVFGYQGPFYLAPYGKVFFVATNREKLVSLARGRVPPLVLSPAQPRAFMAALNEQIHPAEEQGMEH
jgi:hypothetical protein